MLDPKTGMRGVIRDPARLPGHSRAPAAGCTGIHDSPGLAGVCERTSRRRRAGCGAPQECEDRRECARNRNDGPRRRVQRRRHRATHGLRRRTAGGPRRPQADDRRRRPRDASVRAREESRDLVRRCRAWRPRFRRANPRRHPGTARDRVHQAAPQRPTKREPGRRARQADGSRAGPLPDGTGPSCGRLRKNRTASPRRQARGARGVPRHRRARRSELRALPHRRRPLRGRHDHRRGSRHRSPVRWRADDTLQPRVVPGAARHTRGRRPGAHTAAEGVAAAAGGSRRRPRPLG